MDWDVCDLGGSMFEACLCGIVPFFFFLLLFFFFKMKNEVLVW